MRALPENIDRRHVLPELARAIRDGGQYSQVMPEINSYYRVYYPAFVDKVSPLICCLNRDQKLSTQNLKQECLQPETATAMYCTQRNHYTAFSLFQKQILHKFTTRMIFR